MEKKKEGEPCHLTFAQRASPQAEKSKAEKQGIATAACEKQQQALLTPVLP